MPYRVIIEHNPTRGGIPAGRYVYSEPMPAIDRVPGDDFSLHSYAAALQLQRRMSGMYPTVTYRVVGQWNAADWDGIAARYGATPSPAPVADDADDEDEDADVLHCYHCGEDGHDEDDSRYHAYHYCDNCEWSCEVPDCMDCVGYGPDGDWCSDCSDRYDDEEGGSEGSPGLELIQCPTCHSYDVHHDDIAERFVCDCKARRLLADRRPVTLARPLPELEVVA